MNKTETMAYSWLIKQGYKDIKFQSNKSPDFITSNGNFEVKKITAIGTILFSPNQLKHLLDIPNLKLLIYTNGIDLIDIVDGEYLKQYPKFISGHKVYYEKRATFLRQVTCTMSIELSDTLKNYCKQIHSTETKLVIIAISEYLKTITNT